MLEQWKIASISAKLESGTNNSGGIARILCSHMLHKATAFTIPQDTHTDARESEPSVELSMYGEGEWEDDEAAAVVAPMAARYDNASRLDLSEWLRVIFRSI